MSMIHWNFKKWIYISIENPFKTMNKLKGIFRPLNCYFKYSFKEWNPVLWCSEPSYIQIMFHDVMWKDKYDTPRYEVPPYIWIHIYKLNLIWYWDLPVHEKGIYIDDYWEQALWYLNYSNKDIEKAKETWPWSDYNNQSTWTNKFLIK